jgi:hypothetical protein
VADLLKGTLWWSGNPTWTLVDNNMTGATLGATLTAAGAHDASDATHTDMTVAGDGVGIEGDAEVSGENALTACPAGGIKFVRLKVRARAVVAGAGSVQAIGRLLLDGIAYETAIATVLTLTGVYQDFTVDMAVDPVDELPWTVAKVDGHTWGLHVRAFTQDPGVWGTSVAVRFSEYTLEVWGEDVTATVTGASSDALPSAAVASQGNQDGSILAPLVMTIDGGSVPAVARSFEPFLRDQTTATKIPDTESGAGTFSVPLYGAGTQGLIGSSGAGNGINGTGAISGVKAYAIIRVSKQAAATITNVRFGTTMGLKALVTPPTIRDYDQPLTEAMWETVETDIIPTGAVGNPFTWGNGTDSVWASFFGWTMNFTSSGGGFTQVEVAEAWVEIIGPVGAGDTSAIELTLTLGMAPRIMKVQSQVL